ncbi:sulfate permease [Leucobacter sp. W1478]|uniref:sulfate permease n=1 Tax=Leucobacter sp. W1478 TaxID=3439065 RepID=UPI003F30B1EA
MPTNILIALIRRRRGLKWGVPAMLLAVPYTLAAAWCSDLIDHGGPGWLHLVILICLWNAMKFIVMGPISVMLLLRWRHFEAVARRESVVHESPAEPTPLLSR